MVPPPLPPCAGTTQAQFKRYADKVFKNWQKPIPSRKAEARLKRMRANACSETARANMGRTQRGLRAFNPKPPPGTIHSCVLGSESGYSIRATNGSHWNIGQWDVSTWQSHRALVAKWIRKRIPMHPVNVPYRLALEVFVKGFQRYGCDPWCPYDPC